MSLAPSDPVGRKARQRRRACIGIVTAAFTFVLLQVAYHVPTMLGYPQLLDVEYGNKLTNLRAKLAHKPSDQPLVLCMGSSLTAMGMRPGSLQDTETADARHPLVFNFAINNTNIVMQLLCLRRLLHEGIRPNCVLLEIWPGFYTFDRKDPDYKIHPSIDRLMREDISVVSRYHRNPHELRQEWRAAQWVPWYNRRHRIQNWLMPSWIPKEKRVDHLWRYTDESGWDQFPDFIAHWKKFYPHDPKYVDSIKVTMDFWNKREITEDLHGALREFIALCRQEKIGIALVWMPESSHYRNNYSPALSGRVARWHERIIKETGVPIINARDWVDDAGFIEGFHNNPEGATVYTQRLEREVIRPMMAGSLPAGYASRAGGP